MSINVYNAATDTLTKVAGMYGSTPPTPVEDLDLLSEDVVGSYQKTGSFTSNFTFTPDTSIDYNQTSTTTSGTWYTTTMKTFNTIDLSNYNRLVINVTNYAIISGSESTYTINITSADGNTTYKSINIDKADIFDEDVSSITDTTCRISLVAYIRRPSSTTNNFRWTITDFLLKA